jgi:hypothetical protein
MLGVLVTSYTMVQQSLRLGANVQPQFTAEALAAAVASGDPAAAIATLNPFTGVTALVVQDGHVLASNPTWSGAVPPAGVLAAATVGRPNRVTWQDAGGVRRALVVSAVPNRPGVYAVAFQPLAPIESIIDLITRIWLLASLAVVAVDGLWIWASTHHRRA